MRWIERKLARTARKWKVKEAMVVSPTKRQRRELKGECTIGAALGV